MDADEHDEFAALLSARRAGAAASLRALGASSDELRRSRGEATADDEHDPEDPTLSAEWSRLEGLRAGAARELAEIDVALRRLDEGDFGVCEACGRGIPIDRLRARPMATRCVACAA